MVSIAVCLVFGLFCCFCICIHVGSIFLTISPNTYTWLLYILGLPITSTGSPTLVAFSARTSMLPVPSSTTSSFDTVMPYILTLWAIVPSGSSITVGPLSCATGVPLSRSVISTGIAVLYSTMSPFFWFVVVIFICAVFWVGTFK